MKKLGFVMFLLFGSFLFFDSIYAGCEVIRITLIGNGWTITNFSSPGGKGTYDSKGVYYYDWWMVGPELYFYVQNTNTKCGVYYFEVIKPVCAYPVPGIECHVSKKDSKGNNIDRQDCTNYSDNKVNKFSDEIKDIKLLNPSTRETDRSVTITMNDCK